MGLDQYLMRKVNNGDDVTEIYWRKANFIHAFILENRFDECASYCEDIVEDNCVPFPISRQELEDLLSRCKTVLANKGCEDYADCLLPTMSGFFFGSTEYGNWYWQDIEYTIKEVEALLERTTEDDELYYYAWY